MSNEFDLILSEAKKVREKNLNEYNEILEEERIKQEHAEFEKKIKVIGEYNDGDYKKNGLSVELIELIDKYNFNVHNHKINNSIDAYDSVLETYHCSYRDWSFNIKNMKSWDIEGGIFGVDSLMNVKSSEKVDFYCDLRCNNTSKLTLDNFLEFLNYGSIDDYIEHKYPHLLKLPELLSKAGFDVHEYNYNIGLRDASGYIDLGLGKVYVVVYRGIKDDFKLVVTNNKKWGINSMNTSYGFLEKGYYFEYKSEEDINELVNCIKAFKEDISGKIGYLEKDIYYGNKYIEKYFDSLKNRFDGTDVWNHSLIKYERKRFWDKRGYDEKNSKIVNKYRGLEIYFDVDLIFNEAAQWSVGSMINRTKFIFQYDKKKCNDVVLEISNYIYKEDDEYYIYDETRNEDVLNNEFLIDRVVMKGSFLDIIDKAKTYIDKMIDIYVN